MKEWLPSGKTIHQPDSVRRAIKVYKIVHFNSDSGHTYWKQKNRGRSTWRTRDKEREPEGHASKQTSICCLPLSHGWTSDLCLPAWPAIEHLDTSQSLSTNPVHTFITIEPKKCIRISTWKFMRSKGGLGFVQVKRRLNSTVTVMSKREKVSSHYVSVFKK